MDIYLKAVIFSVSLQLSQSTMTTTQLPPGIYRIVVAGGVPLCLTRQGHAGVTILPSGEPGAQQEVIRRFLTSSIVCRSPALLVVGRAW